MLSYVRPSVRCFSHIISFNLQNIPMILGIDFILLLQRQKLWCGEAIWVAWGHIAYSWWSCGLDLCLLDSKAQQTPNQDDGLHLCTDQNRCLTNLCLITLRKDCGDIGRTGLDTGWCQMVLSVLPRNEVRGVGGSGSPSIGGSGCASSSYKISGWCEPGLSALLCGFPSQRCWSSHCFL